MRLLILCFLLISSPNQWLSAEPPLEISFFEDLKGPDEKVQNLNLQRVRIRGFLYQAKDGRLILAAEPNLKSCCVAAVAQRKKQIVISGHFNPPQHQASAIVVEGIFSVHPSDQSYHLTDAHQVVEDSKWPFLLLILAGCSMILGLLLFKLKKR